MLMITFIGLLAVFVVVNNHYQLWKMENKINSYKVEIDIIHKNLVQLEPAYFSNIKDMEKEFEVLRLRNELYYCTLKGLIYFLNYPFNQ